MDIFLAGDVVYANNREIERQKRIDQKSFTEINQKLLGRVFANDLLDQRKNENEPFLRNVIGFFGTAQHWSGNRDG